MAKVTITITDNADGSVNIEPVLDPPLPTGPVAIPFDLWTNAQKLGAKGLMTMRQACSGGQYSDGSPLEDLSDLKI